MYVKDSHGLVKKSEFEFEVGREEKEMGVTDRETKK
jgi:hypothetical protein